MKGIRTSWKGMRLTFRHLLDARRQRQTQSIQNDQYFSQPSGIATLRYPYETVPVPDHGRYQLHNEIEDCIVCDKCAKICPVDCVDIEPIKSPEEFGKTSDGTSKRIYAAKFDIDMAKCCFCGLCTTVCPTECLTMTPEYDFSVFELGKMNFGFGNLTEEEAQEKRTAWEVAQAKKLAAKSAGADISSPAPSAESGKRSPVRTQTKNTELPVERTDTINTEAPQPTQSRPLRAPSPARPKIGAQPEGEKQAKNADQGIPGEVSPTAINQNAGSGSSDTGFNEVPSKVPEATEVPKMPPGPIRTRPMIPNARSVPADGPEKLPDLVNPPEQATTLPDQAVASPAKPVRARPIIRGNSPESPQPNE